MNPFKEGTQVVVSEDTQMGGGPSKWTLKAGTVGTVRGWQREDKYYYVEPAAPIAHPVCDFTYRMLYLAPQYLEPMVTDQLPFFEGCSKERPCTPTTPN